MRQIFLLCSPQTDAKWSENPKTALKGEWDQSADQKAHFYITESHLKEFLWNVESLRTSRTQQRILAKFCSIMEVLHRHKRTSAPSAIRLLQIVGIKGNKKG